MERKKEAKDEAKKKAEEVVNTFIEICSTLTIDMMKHNTQSILNLSLAQTVDTHDVSIIADTIYNLYNHLNTGLHLLTFYHLGLKFLLIQQYHHINQTQVIELVNRDLESKGYKKINKEHHTYSVKFTQIVVDFQVNKILYTKVSVSKVIKALKHDALYNKLKFLQVNHIDKFKCLQEIEEEND